MQKENGHEDGASVSLCQEATTGHCQEGGVYGVVIFFLTGQVDLTPIEVSIEAIAERGNKIKGAIESKVIRVYLSTLKMD